eukprot:71565_1
MHETCAGVNINFRTQIVGGTNTVSESLEMELKFKTLLGITDDDIFTMKKINIQENAYKNHKNNAKRKITNPINYKTKSRRDLRSLQKETATRQWSASTPQQKLYWIMKYLIAATAGLGRRTMKPNKNNWYDVNMVRYTLSTNLFYTSKATDVWTIIGQATKLFESLGFVKIGKIIKHMQSKTKVINWEWKWVSYEVVKSSPNWIENMNKLQTIIQSINTITYHQGANTVNVMDLCNIWRITQATLKKDMNEMNGNTNSNNKSDIGMRDVTGSDPEGSDFQKGKKTKKK